MGYLQKLRLTNAELSHNGSPAKDFSQWIATGLDASFFFRKYQRSSKVSQAINATGRIAFTVCVVLNYPGVWPLTKSANASLFTVVKNTFFVASRIALTEVK